jgi:hypothetical protein
MVSGWAQQYPNLPPHWKQVYHDLYGAKVVLYWLYDQHERAEFRVQRHIP